MVVARQRPSTAKGVVFLLLEDEFGQMNLIVPPQVYERFRPVVRAEKLVLARGRFERQGRNQNVLVREIETLAPLARRLAEVDQLGSITSAHAPLRAPLADSGWVAPLALAATLCEVFDGTPGGDEVGRIRVDRIAPKDLPHPSDLRPDVFRRRVLSDEEFRESNLVGSDTDQMVDRLREIEGLGATIVVLMNISGAAPEEAVRVYGERVLPALR